MAQEKIHSEGSVEKDFTEILFEDRNKGYGAYLLRRLYAKHILISLGITVGALVLALLMPFIIDLLTPEAELTEQDQIIIVDNLQPPPGALNPVYIPPPVYVPPVHTPPKVVKDSVAEVKEEPKPPIKKEQTVHNDIKEGDTTAATGGGGTGEDSNKVYFAVEEPPSFAKGDVHDYLRENIRYPEEEKVMGREGTVYVSFIVNKDGTLSDVKIDRGVSKGLDAEAIRVVKAMPPWNPAKSHRQPVRIIVKLPITFRLARP